MKWIRTIDYHNKPKDLKTILFVISDCPYTGEKNRVHCGYVIHGKDYESTQWYSYEFPDLDQVIVITDDVEAWMPLPSYPEVE